MSSAQQAFTVANNTAFLIVLDDQASKNLNKAWPTVIPANTTVTFQQAGNLDFNPVAVYLFPVDSGYVNVRMAFFCAAVPLTHVHMTMEFGQNQFIAGSSIAENNSDGGKSYNTNSQPDKHGALGIKINSDASAADCSAIFTIG